MSDRNSRLSLRCTAAERSRYWMLRRGLRSERTMVWPCSERCWINISVASAIMTEAALEQRLMSGSRATILRTRETGKMG